jgi:hypothetical protein
MNLEKVLNSKKFRIIGISILLFILVILYFSRFEEVGVTPLYNYCQGLKVDSKIIHKVLPDAKFKIGSFVYHVDEDLSNKLIKESMEDFKNSIERGALPATEDYWADPYCVGHQFWLE